jgi:hypothetical protein
VDVAPLAEGVGIFLATFVATWATQTRPMSKRLNDVAGPDELRAIREQQQQDLRDLWAAVNKLNESCVRDSTKQQGLSEQVQRALDAIATFETRLSSTVTDEEFQSYVANTQNCIRDLIEKLGRAVGTMDAWSTQQGGRVPRR